MMAVVVMTVPMSMIVATAVLVPMIVPMAVLVSVIMTMTVLVSMIVPMSVLVIVPMAMLVPMVVAVMVLVIVAMVMLVIMVTVVAMMLVTMLVAVAMLAVMMVVMIVTVLVSMSVTVTVMTVMMAVVTMMMAVMAVMATSLDSDGFHGIITPGLQALSGAPDVPQLVDDMVRIILRHELDAVLKEEGQVSTQELRRMIRSDRTYMLALDISVDRCMAKHVHKGDDLSLRDGTVLRIDGIRQRNEGILHVILLIRRGTRVERNRGRSSGDGGDGGAEE